jgi:hypothetical protein
MRRIVAQPALIVIDAAAESEPLSAWVSAFIALQ